MAAAWVAALAGGAMVALGAFPELQFRGPVTAMAAAFIPYGVLAWLVVTAVALTSRRWRVRWVALVGVAAMVLQASWTRPYWSGTTTAAEASASPLTVMALNTYYGWADADQLAAAADRYRPDVVVLSELTEGGWERLRETGWEGRFPHRVGEPGEAWTNGSMMVFSPHPLEVLSVPATSDETFVLRVFTPAGPVTVFAVHVANPWDGFGTWRTDLATVRQEATARLDEDLVVVGDFNAVREHEPMRQLLATGLADAAEQSGSGWLPTYPAQRLYGALTGVPYPSLIGIDHVLLGPGMAAEAVDTFRVDGTITEGSSPASGTD